MTLTKKEAAEQLKELRRQQHATTLYVVDPITGEVKKNSLWVYRQKIADDFYDQYCKIIHGVES